MNENEVKFETEKHILTVRKLIDIVRDELYNRGTIHDKSKLEEPEFSSFKIYTEKLKGSTYGSDEYKQFLKEMKPALDHHYSNNRHHPEHFIKHVCNVCFLEYIIMPGICRQCGNSTFQEESDISQMNIVDLVEMFCDWKASTLRDANGDLNKSIELNTNRFKLSPQLRQIFLNSVSIFEENKGNPKNGN